MIDDGHFLNVKEIHRNDRKNDRKNLTVMLMSSR